MFKSRPKERYLFTTRRQKRRQRRFSWLWLLLSGLLSLLILELVTRIFIDITGKRAEFASASNEQNLDENLTNAYQLKFINEAGESYPGASETGSLVAQRSLSVGYKLVENQDNPYWKINPQGFRDNDSIPLVKPQGEIRIFLLGSSTAFGYGSSSNQTAIAESLEFRLQERLKQQQKAPQLYRPDLLPLEEPARAEALKKPAKIKSGNYRVINAAVPGYASGNQLAQLALQIIKYKPDLILVLNGYEDLMLTGDKTATQLPQSEEYLNDAPSYFLASVNKFLQPVEEYSYLVKMLQDSVLKPQDVTQDTIVFQNKTGSELVEIAPHDKTELQRRIDRYFQNHKQIVTIATGAKADVIFALQPEITGRNPSKLTPTEGEIVTQLGRKYIQTIKDNYPRFVVANQYLANLYPKNVKALDLYHLNNNYPSPSFIDGIHLTENANAMVAEQFYSAIASSPKMQVALKEPPKPQVTPTTKPLPIKPLSSNL
jgi:hypothetical protein